MSHAHPSMHAIAQRLQSALESASASTLGELLDAGVTWGDCAGRSDVERFIDGALAPKMAVSDVSVEVLDDRLLLSLSFGEGAGAHRSHHAIFVADGRIVEIRDVADRARARSVRPVGPLAVAAARSSRFEAAAPVLPVRDLAEAVAHYRTLGFEARLYEGGAAYAFASRDGVDMHLCERANLEPDHNTSTVYLYVSDADALYAQWRCARPTGRLVAPVDTEYGLREGAYIDADGNVLRFGSPLSTREEP